MTIYPKDNCVYYVGIDPAWLRATDDLTFINSYKMKLAVILGVLQMCLGICLKAFNNIHYGKMMDFFF